MPLQNPTSPESLIGYYPWTLKDKGLIKQDIEEGGARKDFYIE